MGFIRTAAAVPQLKVADPSFNIKSIKDLAQEAEKLQASLTVFPELSVTGYTCADLFQQNILLQSAEEGVSELVSFSKELKGILVVGAPVEYSGRLYNCAIVIKGGEIKGIVPKIHLPFYGEFYESRWFSSGSDFLGTSDCCRITYAGQECPISPNIIFTVGQTSFAIEICEDLWTPIPPSSYHALAGAEIILNLSASNEVLMKDVYRQNLISQQSARTLSGYVYCSSGFGESTQDLVYAGVKAIYENGAPLAVGERFLNGPSITAADIDTDRIKAQRKRTGTFRGVTPDGRTGSFSDNYTRVDLGDAFPTDFRRELLRQINPLPFVPNGQDKDYRCKEVLSIQVSGLAKRLSHIGCRSAVIGISGGLDSTLALIVTALAFDSLGWSRERIVGITMPGYGTTARTRSNATDLMEALGVSSREISIKAACDRHFEDIGHDPSVHDITYENSQARERTQILMDVANQTGGIVIGTGDLSELALGWATYNGDHMSMYGVNVSIPKTLVKHLVSWAASNHFKEEKSSDGRSVKDILLDIVDTPISPELLPVDAQGRMTQKTEDLVGPYELHDFFLYNFFRFGYSPEKILFLARKAFPQDVYSDEVIEKWLKTFLRRFFSQQFKRSCLPDGPKVGTVSLSPRGDWRMPSDASSSAWILPSLQ